LLEDKDNKHLTNEAWLQDESASLRCHVDAKEEKQFIK
jgi:hypothetical protein